MPEQQIQKAKVVFAPPANAAELIAAEAALMAARLAAPTGDVIRINKDKTFALPDGSTNDTIDAVIVDFVSMNQFYPGKFDPKDFKPPVCMALGVERKEMRPFESSPQKQSEFCVSCPMGQWGSDGKGKACKDQRLLALVAPAAQDDGALMVLKVSPTGTRYWDQYASGLAAKSDLPFKKVTRIEFDQKSDYASLRFSVVGPNDGWATAFGRRTEARKRLLTEPELGTFESAAPVKK